jgi:hypothetical protein
VRNTKISKEWWVEIVEFLKQLRERRGEGSVGVLWGDVCGSNLAQSKAHSTTIIHNPILMAPPSTTQDPRFAFG